MFVSKSLPTGSGKSLCFYHNIDLEKGELGLIDSSVRSSAVFISMVNLKSAAMPAESNLSEKIFF